MIITYIICTLLVIMIIIYLGLLFMRFHLGGNALIIEHLIYVFSVALFILIGLYIIFWMTALR